MVGCGFFYDECDIAVLNVNMLNEKQRFKKLSNIRRIIRWAEIICRCPNAEIRHSYIKIKIILNFACILSNFLMGSESNDQPDSNLLISGYQEDSKAASS